MRCFLIPLAAGLVALSGCHAKTGAPGEAPTGVNVTSGDGLAVVNWDVLPDLTYWIFFQAGDSVSVGATGSLAIRRAIAPRVVSGLTNETQYAFAMNATHNDSSAGPLSLPVLQTPHLAGTTWIAGTPLAATNLRDLAFNGSRFVTVGDAATIFAGDFSYTAGAFPFTPGPQGVTQWMPPTTLPLGFASDLSSIIFTGSYVALGTDGSVILSGDGLTWTSYAPVPAGGMRGLAYGVLNFGEGPAVYVAVGDGGAIYVNDQTLQNNWTLVPSGTTQDLTGISLQGRHFIVTGTGGTLLASDDPRNNGFTGLTSNTTNTLRAVTFGPSSTSTSGLLYVAVGDAGTVVTSPGITSDAAGDMDFTPPLAPPGIAQNLRAVTVGGAAGSRFLAVGDAGAVAFSDDGATWSSIVSLSSNRAKSLYVGGLYLGIGDAGANDVSR